MLGTSLPLAWFTERDPQLQAVLALLKSRNVRSVELRTVRPHHEPEAVQKAANLLWENGFQITVHGSISGIETAVTDVFAPLESTLASLRQETLNITIHPIAGDNVAMLIKLSDYIEENNLPVTIALENNRLLPDKTEGDSAALVLDAVKAVNRKNVGICFDMGHYTYYVKKNCPDAPDTLPEKEFWKRVIHTHIHAMDGLRTHFPLDGYELPLEAYLKKLSCGYFGVYNLELDFPRILPLRQPIPALENAIDYLQKKLHFCAQLYDTIREHFDDWFHSALSCWEKDEGGISLSLIHSCACLLRTGDCKWAIDLAFRNAYHLAKTPWQTRQLLADMDLLIFSHGHADHYEETTLQMLVGSKTLVVVPDFLEERTRNLGFSDQQLRIAYPDRPLTLFGMTILPFVSSHFRPSGRGTEEYGYYITAPGKPSMVFPADIRDHSKMPALPPADYCFANVWLEDDAADPASWRPMIEPFSNYMLQFSHKHIILTHLYENGRRDGSMWYMEHAEAVKQHIAVLSPTTRVLIPTPGECFSLT